MFQVDKYIWVVGSRQREYDNIASQIRNVADCFLNTNGVQDILLC